MQHQHSIQDCGILWAHFKIHLKNQVSLLFNFKCTKHFVCKIQYTRVKKLNNLIFKEKLFIAKQYLFEKFAAEQSRRNIGFRLKELQTLFKEIRLA